MEEIIFKNKPIKILEKLGNHHFKVSYKNKVFVIRDFNIDSDEFKNFLKYQKRLQISGVRIPKIKKIDKKNQLVLMEYVQGKSVFETLLTQDLGEPYFQQIFEASWYADHEKITLDFYPHNWIMSDKNLLYYMPFNYADGIDDKAPFKTTMIKFWFFTKEFYEYAKSKGAIVDKSRLKDEYATNKQIVLTVVQYYF